MCWIIFMKHMISSCLSWSEASSCAQMYVRTEVVFVSVVGCLTDAADDVVRRALAVLAEICSCAPAATTATATDTTTATGDGTTGGATGGAAPGPSTDSYGKTSSDSATNMSRLHTVST